jgi:amino acid adenylation domain-containing protein
MVDPVIAAGLGPAGQQWTDAGRRLVEQWRSGSGAFGRAIIGPRDPDAKTPLSLAQEQLWFMQLLNPGSPAYVTSYCAWLYGAVDEQALAASVEAIAGRHEILRTVFRVTEGEADQVITDRSAVRLETVDLTVIPGPQRTDRALKLGAQACREPFDLARGPLARALIIRLGDDLRLLALVAHHLVCDGTSLDIVLQELSVLYSAYRRQAEARLPPVRLQYGDFSAWQRSSARWHGVDGLEYWKKRLTGVPVLDLPTDRVRPRVRDLAAHRLALGIPAQETDALRLLAQKTGTTLFMIVLAGYQAVLGRAGAQDEVCVGSAVANRSSSQVRTLVGPVMNLLALRVGLGGDPTFTDLLARVQQGCLEAYRHQSVPFQHVVEAVSPGHDTAHHPVFQAALVFQNFAAQDNWLDGVRAQRLDLGADSTPYDLELDLHDTGSELAGCLRYATDLVPDDLAARLVRWLRRFLAAVAENPGIRIAAVPLLSAGERRRITQQRNATRADLPATALHGLIAEQARRTPAAAAVEFAGATLSFGELEQRANRLAHYLRSLGVGPDSVVGICMERSAELVIALLAILKAGGAYLPLDPRFPSGRLSFMLEDTGCRIVLSQGCPPPQMAEGRILVQMEAAADAISEQSPAAPVITSRPENAAYVIYTSGSTGSPKGVVIPHLGIKNRVLWTIRRHALSPADRVLHKTPLTFDAAGWEILAPLVCGGTVVVARPGAHADPHEIVSAVTDEAVTVLQLVPSMLELVVEEPGLERARSLRLMFCAGEPFPARLCDRLFERLPGLEVYNTYGPAECSVDVTAHRCGPGMTGAIAPIGRPIHNTWIYLLDRDLQPVPYGAVGELYVGGAGLARGYVGRPALTADRFIADPFSASGGGRLYRTGDLGRYRPDGTIAFAGRRDSQVKVRGVRIELGEVESAIARHKAVRQVAVAACRGQTPAQSRLVGYLVPTGDARPSVTELRDFLVRRLPDIMIPNAYVWLDALPLTSSGKIDRNALPAPPLGERPDVQVAYVAPHGTTEQMVAGIWEGLLGVKPVGRQDNFFELGGHSIMAAQVVGRVGESLSIDLPIRLIFERPTIAGLAAALMEGTFGRSAAAPIARLPRVPVARSPAPRREADAGAPRADAVSTRVLRSFADIAPGDWNAAGPRSLFASARWLSGVEGTLSEHNAYALIRREGRIAGALAAYLVGEGAFAPMNPAELLVATDMLEQIAPFQSAAERRRTAHLSERLAPELAGIGSAAVCACPYSREAAMLQRDDSRDTALALVRTLDEIAGTWQARSAAALYLPHSLSPELAAVLDSHGYVRTTLAARSVLNVQWPTIAGYADKMRRARPEIRAWQESGLEVSTSEALPDLITEIAPLYARHLQKYGAPLDIEAARRTLTWIDERFSDLASVVVVRDEGRALAFHLYFEAGDTIYSYFSGQTYDELAHKTKAFFIASYYEPIRLAMNKGATTIDYGIGSYDTKTARGCELVPLHGFFRFADRRITDEVPEYFALLDAAWTRLIRRYQARVRG